MHCVNYHHCVCTSWRSSSLAHYRSSTVALLSYLDHVAILHYHALTILSRCYKVALHTISNRAFIAVLETILVGTKYVYTLFSMVFISLRSNVFCIDDVCTMWVRCCKSATPFCTIIRVFKRTLYLAEQLLMFISSVLQKGVTPLPVDHGLVDQLFLQIETYKVGFSTT